jgi:hypothetical protein
MILNEDNYTREWLNKIRRLNESVNENPTEKTSEIVINRSDEKFMEFSRNITQFVGALKTDEKAMIVYPNESDVIFNGVITDMNNLKFQFRYNDQSGGLYIWADSMLLTKEISEKLAKLVIIRDQWKEYWANNISQYQSN